MADPRNVAHDKKVKQEKEHQTPGAAEAKSKKRRKGPAAAEAEKNETAPAVVEQAPGELEKSLAVLSKLKEMEFHSRANIETLAELMLTIDDELKQKEFSKDVEEVYAAQDGFQTKVGALIEKYEAKAESLKPSV
ncbi:hypothetical protein BH18VER1_BH18VER1_08590 [soil metagenome]